jgi:hypothetical protein
MNKKIDYRLRLRRLNAELKNCQERQIDDPGNDGLYYQELDLKAEIRQVEAIIWTELNQNLD